MLPDRRRHETPIALAIFALATLLLAWPAFGGLTLLNPNSDQYIAGFAFRDFAAQSLRAGQGFPLWNPYLFGGMPYVAAMHGDIFYPTFLLRLLLPTDAGMTWGMIIHVFLAGVFSWLFLRRAVGLGATASLIGGIAYLMGGNVAGLVSPGHDGKIFVAALLPLVLFLVHRAVGDGRNWAWGALIAAITLAVLTPHPQLLQYLLLMAGAYALFVALAASPEGTKLPWATALRRLGAAAVCVGLGLLGGAVQFWPLLEYTPYSPRAGGKGWEHAISYSMPPEELLNFYLPQFSGILEQYAGRNIIHLHSEYVGVVTLVLAGLAFGIARSHRRVLFFWLGALVVSTLWALGGYTPFFSLVYAIVPGTDFFRAPSTMLYVVSLCIAVLAALGTERVLQSGIRTRYAAAWGGIGLLFVLLAFSGGLSSLAAAFSYPQLLPRIESNADAVRLGSLRSLLFLALTLATLVLLSRKRLAPAVASWGLVALLAADLWSIERLYWKFAPPASELYAGDATTEYLRRAPQPARVMSLAGAELSGTRRDPFLGGGEGKGTGFMVHGIRSIVGYHGNELGRYQELTGWETDQYGARVSNSNLWRLLNVRYLYTNAPRPAGDPLVLVAGPVRNTVGNMAYLYELPGENPYAWVTPIAVTVPDESALATVLDERFDISRVAIFAAGSAVPTQPVPATLPEPSDVRVQVTKWAPGSVSLALDKPAPAGATLVVSENWYPGWIATVNGAAVPLARADYSLIGIGLPAGARSVELQFTSPRYERGKLITLLVLFVAAAALVLGAVRDRRRGRSELAPG